MGSITSGFEMVTDISKALSVNESVVRIGPAPVPSKSGDEMWRLIFKYPYSEGQAVAKLLKIEVARVAAGKTRFTASGRSARAVTVKMNDAEVV
jgi:hypothetical protein